MRRITTLIVLIALFSLPLMAGETSSSSDVNVVAAADQAKPAAAPKAAPARKTYPGGAGETGGWLFKSIFGEGLQKKTGIQIENYVQMGCSTNTATDKFSANFGQGNWPDPVVNDTGCAFQDIDLVIHRDMVTNLLPGVGPIPGPTPKKFGWSFYQNTLYGRSSSSAAMTGFDKQWAINDPGDYNPNFAQITKQNTVALPNAWAAVYIPVFKGMVLRFGRAGVGIGWDIPPQVRPGPDLFASKSFSMVTEPSQSYGLVLAANILRDKKLGMLSGEFGVNNGWQVYHPVSGKKDFQTALRWRSPKMSTGVNYAAMFGPKNILPGAACTNSAPSGSGLCASNLQGPNNMSPASFSKPGLVWNGASYMPGWVSAGLTSLPAGVGAWGVSSQYLGSYYHVISPRDQMALSNAINFYHNFGSKWRWIGEVNFGKQWADGRPDTLQYVGPNHYQSGYKGGSYWGTQTQVAYQWKKNVAFDVRGEHLNNQSGLGLYPVCAFYGSAAPGGQLTNCKTDLNDVAFNVRYEPSKFILIYPEVRYDWQSNNHGLSIFGAQNLDVAYPVGTIGSIVPMNSASLLPAATALSRNNNAHTHNFVATFNVVLYF